MESISSPKTTNFICTTKCGYTAFDRMIQCGQCEGFTHFNCTLLPGYQLQQMMTKGYRKYICAQCFVKVDKIYCNNEIEGDQEEPGVEPAINNYQLAMMEEENEELKSENSELSEKLSMANAELTETEYEITQVKTSRSNLYIENCKLQREINRLENTLADTRSLLEQETELRKNTDNKHRKLVTSSEADLEVPGNIQQESEPNSNNMTNFEHVMVGKIQIMSELITKSVQKEIHEYNKHIESKINLIMEKTQFGKDRTQNIEAHAIPNTVEDMTKTEKYVGAQ
jgi:predicted RNase H-like nuclease (RuvC/YqgF family)